MAGAQGNPGGARGTSIKFDALARQKVIDMAAAGQELFVIARELGCTKRMLMYRCRREIAEGRELAVMNGVPLPKYVQVPNNREEVSEEQKFQIETMAAIGLPVDHIAVIMGMPKITLVAYCQEDIDRGRAKGHDTVASKLFDMASDGEHPNQTQFYLTHKCKWKETPTEIQFPDAEGNPQKISGDTNIVLDAEMMKTLIDALNEKV